MLFGKTGVQVYILADFDRIYMFSHGNDCKWFQCQICNVRMLFKGFTKFIYSTHKRKI